MQDKILERIYEQQITESIEIDYENFKSEIESNTKSFNINKGKSVKFEHKVQLYHESSKRFLAFYNCKVDEIKRIFKNEYYDSDCYYLGFSEYPSSNTQFSFETVVQYQQEEDGYVKKHHYVYLT